jgi:hypothetical protein
MNVERAARISSRILAIGACALFGAMAFRDSWRSPTPDFSLYYTGAKALLEGDRLRDLYDWTAFERMMSRAGIDDQIGGWAPNPPLTMLPMVPLASFPPGAAMRMWNGIGLALLLTTLWILSRLSRIRLEYLLLLAACGFTAFFMNFILGQYYIVLLFLLTLAWWCLERNRPAAAGVWCGVAFGLKLYAAPFLLYFAMRRNWRALAAMSATMLTMAALAIGLFGWPESWHYATVILPRTLDSGSQGLYHPAVASLTALLRRTFVAEPELNPSPVLNAPWAFFFLRAFLLLSILAFALIGIRKTGGCLERHAFAWFSIALLLLSPHTPHYTFMLLLLPVVLLMEDAGAPRRFLLAVWFTLMTLNLPFPALFPKAWLLLMLYGICGLPYWRSARPGWMVAIAACALLIAGVGAHFQMASYEREPGRRFRPFAVEKGKLFSDFPAVTTAGVFYQSTGGTPAGGSQYVLHWLHNDGSIEALRFDGSALHPVALGPQGPIQFELVTRGRSRSMQFDPRTRNTSEGHAPGGDSGSVTSPDGKWIAWTSTAERAAQIVLKNTVTGAIAPLTGGNCNNFSPAWTLDSKALIFASDCDRALGIPALYRAEIPVPAVR